ncbi:hypothetical protein [Mesorhizobium sp. M0006]|uniref:hypothetical protein n=1 Tax=Mesorhizobium sp. M0006 TaxID=2956838 RepID=UPI00333DF9E8
MAKSPIRIRMYNVGFGDCFLIFLPTARGEKKVAIDCGSLKNKEHTIGEISDLLIEDVREADGVARIDVLIMSHRHADHISGYTNPKWSQVEVGEVWMPWLESRDDPEAKAIQKRHRAAALALEAAVNKFALDSQLADVAFNAKSNDDSLDVLHRGFAKRVKPGFFPKGKSVVEKIPSTALPDIEVFVLGPPRDRGALNRPDPPPSQILLTGHREDGEGSEPEKFRPFPDDWEDEYVVGDFDTSEVDRAAAKSTMYELAAAELDAELNNTSLVLLFRVGDDYLLFPGDAQWGPWELILNDEDAVALLRKVTFVKIGHHGSHNGTPKTLLEDILGTNNKKQGIVQAMISMTPYSKWKDIPHQPILDMLTKRRFPFVISDKLQDQAGFTRREDFWFELEIR